TLTPTALANSKWYVDGVNGNDNNDCKSPQHACKTIGRAISNSSTGDTIMIASATYFENLAIGFSLKIVGSGARETVVDARGHGRVVTISNAKAHVAISRITIVHGQTMLPGGGIFNNGTLTIDKATVSDNYASSFLAAGGGISNFGRLTIDGCTV